MTIPLLAHERRAQRFHWAAGEESPRCALCGESDPDALVIHHAGGSAYDGFPVPACKNCHARLTVHQAPYSHLLKRPDCPAWVRDLVRELDMAALLERQAWEFLWRAHDAEERHGPTQETAEMQRDAEIFPDIAARCRERAQRILDHYGSTPEGRALLERPAPHRRTL